MSIQPKKALAVERRQNVRNSPPGRVSTGVSNMPAYRVGDGVAQREDAPGCETYPDSLVCAYKRATRVPNHLPTLLRVIEQRALYSDHTPLGSNVVAVHLRLGDGLCAKRDPPCRGARTSTPDCWRYDNDCWYDENSRTKQYAYSRKWYTHMVQDLKELSKRLGSLDMLIFANKMHWTRTPDPRLNYDVDDAYIASFSGFFRQYGLNVTVHNSGTPDDDFLQLCTSTYFVQGGGGFSALIASVVRARGGEVFVPSIEYVH